MVTDDKTTAAVEAVALCSASPLGSRVSLVGKKKKKIISISPLVE